METKGGAKSFKVSLGFVITDAKHRMLISCYRRTADHDPLSFQTKAGAFLHSKQFAPYNNLKKCTKKELYKHCTGTSTVHTLLYMHCTCTVLHLWAYVILKKCSPFFGNVCTKNNVLKNL